MIHLIDSVESLRNFSDTFGADLEKSLLEDRFIAVDTEFIRENLEKPLLCLIQVATVENVFIIDPLAFDDIDFVKKIFENKEILKVFHGAIQDMDVLHACGIFPQNIHDTQIYEMLLSTKEQESYKSLVHKYLDKKLDKDSTLSDWRKRPLSKKQLKYAVGDVTYLRKIFKLQRAELLSQGRFGWLKDEMAQLEQPKEPKNHQSKSEQEGAILARLSEWVNDRAQKKGIPADKIADDRSLRRVCKRGRRYINKMLKYRRLITDDFRDFLLYAKEILPEDFSSSLRHDPITQALKLILEICSRESDIAAFLIATTDDIEDIIGGKKDHRLLKCLHGWRKEIFGRYVMDFLAGKLSICVNDDSELEFTQK